MFVSLSLVSIIDYNTLSPICQYFFNTFFTFLFFLQNKKQRRSPAFCSYMLYQQFFATIHDSFDLSYRHINCFRKPFISQTVKQAELQDTPVTLRKYPLVNQLPPLETALVEIFCFHRLPFLDFSQSVTPRAFLVLGGRACLAYSCFRYSNHLLRHSLYRRHSRYSCCSRPSFPALSPCFQTFQTGFHMQANINLL